MKSLIIALAVAATVLVVSVDTAEAKLPVGHGYQYRHANKGHGFGHQNNFCKPHRVRTVVVDRDRQCRTGYDRHGRPYTYYVTVVTYRDYYANGTSRTYTRVIS